MTIIDLLHPSRQGKRAYLKVLFKVLICIALLAFAFGFATLLIFAGSVYLDPDR